MKTIGKKLKKVRQDAGMSQLTFAEKLGVTRGYISRIETGGSSPSKQFVNLICKTFFVNKDWLIKDRGPMTWDSEISLKEAYKFNENFSNVREK